MALMPKRIKHRKTQRGRLKGYATRGNTVSFGDFAIQTLEPGWINNRVIEACRIAANQCLHREGKVYIRIFPDKPFTSTPLETRMGKGKGEPEGWVAPVKPGTILFEIGGVDVEIAKRAFVRVSHKLPVRCRFVVRRHGM